MELEIKDITDTAMSASYLVLHLAIDSEVPAKNILTIKENQFSHCELFVNMYQHSSST